MDRPVKSNARTSGLFLYFLFLVHTAYTCDVSRSTILLRVHHMDICMDLNTFCRFLLIMYGQELLEQVVITREIQVFTVKQLDSISSPTYPHITQPTGGDMIAVQLQNVTLPSLKLRLPPKNGCWGDDGQTAYFHGAPGPPRAKCQVFSADVPGSSGHRPLAFLWLGG